MSAEDITESLPSSAR